MRLEHKEKYAIGLREERKLNLMEVMVRSKDWKSRKAREDFHRPAFCGTILAARGQQDHKRNN